ncbi:MAG TPA: signal peptidase II [Tepidisphaeraceae bacterium]|jgi:signal peptidase II
MPIALRSPGALLRFFLVAGLGIAADLWSKWAAFSSSSLWREPYQFIPGWIEFEVVKNQGAVFGLGQGRRILFVTVSVGAILFLIYLFATSGKKPVFQVLLGMLLAGVVGNLYDRVTLGYVRDMIHALPQWPKLFPWVFNVADTMLSTGVGLMILYNIVLEHRQKKKET